MLMAPTAISRLSERQKQCLRLFYANLSAKEIGLELGLSPHTVNEHLRDARKLLGVARSMEAARILVAAEGDNRPVSDAIGVELDEGRTDDARASQIGLVRNRYNLGVLTRIGLIVGIALSAMALAGALLVGAEAITHIFRAEQINLSDPSYK